MKTRALVSSVVTALAWALPSPSPAVPPSPQARPAPVFGVGVEAVYVDVFASSDGKPLGGLTASDFEVRDDGALQAVELLAQGQVPLHALLVLDTSNTLAGGTLEALKQAARAFVAGLRDGDRVSLLTFNERVRLLGRGLDPAAARAALEGARAEGGTALNDALYTALGHADPDQGRPVVVVFSDGDDRLSWLTDDKVLGVARESDATVYAVDTTEAQARIDLPRSRERRNDASGDRAGFLTGQRSQDLSTNAVRPEDAPPTFLQRAADETGGRVLSAARTDLQAAFLSVLAELTSRYVLRVAPSGAPRPGWHELSVRLKGRKGDLRVRRGYYVPAP